MVGWVGPPLGMVPLSTIAQGKATASATLGGMLQQGLVIATRGGRVVLVEGVAGREGLGGE